MYEYPQAQKLWPTESTHTYKTHTESSTCGQKMWEWPRERDGSRRRKRVGTIGGTMKCLVNKLRLPFDNTQLSLALKWML